MARVLILLLLATFGFGCDTLISKSSGSCPPVALIDETASVVKFNVGPGRDVKDVDHSAIFTDVLWSCEYRGNKLSIDLELLVGVSLGPTSTVPSAVLRYFVALSDEHEQLIAKRVFEVVVDFSGQREVHLSEEITQQIRLQEGKSGEDYVIFVGFQLDRDQLEYNRESINP